MDTESLESVMHARLVSAFAARVDIQLAQIDQSCLVPVCSVQIVDSGIHAAVATVVHMHVDIQHTLCIQGVRRLMAFLAVHANVSVA